MDHLPKILVADDEPRIRKLLKEFLTHAGYAVRLAGDGEKTLQELQQESFDGALVDLKMPKLGDLELLRAIRHVSPSLPVIMMTGYPSISIAVKAIQEGAADFITKPIQLDELESTLDKVVRNRTSNRFTPHVLPAISSTDSGLKSPLFSKRQKLSVRSVLSGSSHTLTSTEAVFQQLIGMACEISGAQGASVTILDHEVKNQSRKTVQERAQEGSQDRYPLLDDPLIERLKVDQKPLWLMHGHPCLVVPILIRNELFGILKVWGKENHPPFSKDKQRLLLMLCQQAALNIENQWLYESLYHNMHEMLQVLVSTLEARDPYTQAHSQRVSSYATAIANVMGCNQEEQDIVTVAGLLHDIGKVGICDAILLKRGPLTPDEYEIIKMHPIIGEQIVRQLGCFTQETTIIRHHHEWWDGRGYPDGLKHHQIPFLARIMAVADAYDAMTTNRLYRLGRSAEEAFAELACWAGTQFDPEFVDAFRHVIRKDLSQNVVTSDF